MEFRKRNMGNYLVACCSWIWSLNYGKNRWEGFEKTYVLFSSLFYCLSSPPLHLSLSAGCFASGGLACRWRGKGLMVFATVQTSPWSGRQWKEVSRFMAAWFGHGSCFHCGWPEVDRESERDSARENRQRRVINHSRKVAWDVHTHTPSLTYTHIRMITLLEHRLVKLNHNQLLKWIYAHLLTIDSFWKCLNVWHINLIWIFFKVGITNN